jgi:hypothetical protein
MLISTALSILIWQAVLGSLAAIGVLTLLIVESDNTILQLTAFIAKRPTYYVTTILLKVEVENPLLVIVEQGELSYIIPPYYAVMVSKVHPVNM